MCDVVEEEDCISEEDEQSEINVFGGLDIRVVRERIKARELKQKEDLDQNGMAEVEEDLDKQ